MTFCNSDQDTFENLILLCSWPKNVSMWEITDLVEALALLTVVRLVSVVHAEHVLLQMRQLCKRLLAQFAHVRLLSCVHSQMQFQSRWVGEWSGADLQKEECFKLKSWVFFSYLARVRPFSCMHSHVDSQLGSLVEPIVVTINASSTITVVNSTTVLYWHCKINFIFVIWYVSKPKTH